MCTEVSYIMPVMNPEHIWKVLAKLVAKFITL